MHTWIEPSEFSAPEDLRLAVGGHPLVADTLARRGYASVGAARAFLDPVQYMPSSPLELPDMDVAVERLEAAIHDGEHILVWGDFDVDGQTATTLLVSALRGLGARVTYHIPVRARESHGVNVPVLKSFLEGETRFLDTSKYGPVRLVLTCDTGISAHEAVKYAQKRGVDVLVTDHHEPPENLPEARALVNPRFLPPTHPLGALPGVGVAYKLAEALYTRAGREAECEGFLDLVALGIVADVAPQVGEGRYLLQRGLTLLRSPRRLGLQAVYERADLDPTWLTEEHIGFVLAPRLNAIGRLSDANPVVELLTTNDLGQARVLALQLEGLNSRRQLLTSQVFRGALAQLESDPSLLEHAALVLSHPDWPAGVIGIVASRLVERYGKPTAMIATPEGEPGRGSARSVEGVHITDAIASQAGILGSYGGHAMAGGFSIDPERISEFRRGLSQAVEAQLGDLAKRVEPVMQIDGYLDWNDLNLDLVADLERLAPFGPGNPPLILVSRDLHLVSRSQVGRDGEHLLLTIEDTGGVARRVIWWNGSDHLGTRVFPEGRFDLAYQARASTFRGQRDVQVQFLDFRPLEEVVSPEQARPQIEVLDFRDQEHPLPVLKRLLVEEEGALVWAEAEGLKALREKGVGVRGERVKGRYELTPTQMLVVWTAPPARFELMAALERTQAQRVAFFGVDPDLDQVGVFLERMAGLVKYALNSEAGELYLPRLAVAMAHREPTVRVGLEWLAARGLVSLQAEKGKTISLAQGGQLDSPLAEILEAQLKELLEEARAYRAYFARVGAETLLS